MKRSLGNTVLILVIVVMLLGLLGGCCCCPSCPEIEWSPFITLTKPYCEFYDDLRPVTPWSLRDMVKENYGFADLEDTQKAIYNVWGTGGNFVTNFLLQPGCSQLPLAVAKHLDGTEEYLTAVCDNGKDVVFYRISSPSGTLVKKEPDYSIIDVIVN